MSELDVKDKRILYQLDQDSRQSDTQIAANVGLSRDAVAYRIEKLQERGYINYFMTLLNSMKLGFDWYRTFFAFYNLDPETEDEILAWLNEYASWITKVQGTWDVNTGIFCRNVYEFKDILDEFILQYSSYIRKYEVGIVTREWTYHRTFLDDQEQCKADLMGFDSQDDYSTVTLDEIEYQILNVLLRNARMNTVDIARTLDTTETIVRYRIKKLEENGIILGYRPFLNMKKLGYEQFKTHFTLRNLTKDAKQSIYQYVHNHSNTVHTTELVGGDDLETEFIAQNNSEFYNYIDSIRQQFGRYIADYTFMQYTKEYTFSYLPEMQFDM